MPPSIDSIFRFLVPPSELLFYSRNDPDDVRTGDVAARVPGDFPGDARVAVVGVPQDIGVKRNKGRVGAADGPDAIRKALYRLTPFDIDSGLSLPDGFLFDMGNVDVTDTLEEIHERIQSVVLALCELDIVPIVLGGGHDITYPAASGVGGHYGRLGAINLDAHLDVRKSDPDRHSGTSFRMLIEEGSIDPMRTVEMGIQSHANAEAHVEWFRSMGGVIHTLETVRRHGFDESLLTAMRVAGESGGPYYATLDLDSVRSADAPGVSAPMPVGISGQEFAEAARHFGRDPHCVGFDIAELNPKYDVDGKSARLAALATIKFMVGVCHRLAAA